MSSRKNQFFAVNIGNSADSFNRYAAEVLKSYEIEFVNCADIYEATGLISENLGMDVLVVGKIDQMQKEDGRFFDIALARGAWCCCLVETDSVKEYLEILSTVKTGTYLITNQQEFNDVAEKYIDSRRNVFSDSKTDKSEFDGNAFAATEEEINALLNPDFNEFNL